MEKVIDSIETVSTIATAVLAIGYITEAVIIWKDRHQKHHHKAIEKA